MSDRDVGKVLRAVYMREDVEIGEVSYNETG